MAIAKAWMTCVVVVFVVIVFGTALVVNPAVGDYTISCEPPTDTPPKKGGRG